MSINPGGSSKLDWFNPLAVDPAYELARQNLVGKIEDQWANGFGCKEVIGFTAQTRPVLDQRFLPHVSSLDMLPKRFSPYQIAMMQAGKLRPSMTPPDLPAELRQVKRKAGVVVLTQATWVISHLCHNNKCVNPDHLVWEPNWFNRLRDNCLGGHLCVHRPHPCMAAHRSAEIIDWTQY